MLLFCNVYCVHVRARACLPAGRTGNKGTMAKVRPCLFAASTRWLRAPGSLVLEGKARTFFAKCGPRRAPACAACRLRAQARMRARSLAFTPMHTV